MAGSEDEIAANFTTAGINNLKAFLNDGGMLYSSGVGAMLVSRLVSDAVPVSTFNQTHMLVSDGGGAAPSLRIRDCETAADATASVTYEKRALCFGHMLSSNMPYSIMKVCAIFP